ncbi:MAG: hypothetical protein IKE30_00150 [Clostridia bacterium]|nr:hypothetical protein [Clostridia bacterium]
MQSTEKNLQDMNRQELLRCTDALLAENESLKKQYAELRAKAQQTKKELAALEGCASREESGRMREENEQLRAQVRSLEGANRELSALLDDAAAQGRNSAAGESGACEPGNFAQLAMDAFQVKDAVQRAADDFLRRVDEYCQAKRRQADQALSEAREKAEAMLTDAGEKAQGIVGEAESQAAEKQRQADRELAAARDRIEEMMRSAREEYRKVRALIDETGLMAAGGNGIGGQK